MTPNTKPSPGFTIIEVLIVIAITGFILAAAIKFLSGSANSADFTIGINDLRQQLQQSISETTNGYYNNNNTFSCTGDSPNSPTIGAYNPAITQGENYGCLFLGKVIQFSPNDVDDQMASYTVVGNQTLTSGQSPLTIDQASPELVSTNIVTQTLEYGLTAVSMKAQDGSESTTAVGFLAGDAGGNIASLDSNNDLNSGVQSMSLYYLKGTSLDASTNIYNDVTSQNLVPTDNVTICFAGGNNQSGLITIGSSSNNLTVSLSIWSDSTCS